MVVWQRNLDENVPLQTRHNEHESTHMKLKRIPLAPPFFESMPHPPAQTAAPSVTSSRSSTSHFMSPGLEHIQANHGGRVKTIAKQLESVFTKPSHAVTIMQSPRSSVLSDGVSQHRSFATISSHRDEGVPRPSVSQEIVRRRPSPTRPGERDRASKPLQKLQELFASAYDKHSRLWKRMVNTRSSVLRRRFRDSLTTALDKEQVVLGRVEAFWLLFASLMENTVTSDTTPNSMLGNVLIVLVEGRQACLELFEFGKKCRKSWHTIARNVLMAHLLDTIGELEAQSDQLLYLVGMRRASRINSQTLAASAAALADAIDAVGKSRETTSEAVVNALNPIVSAPLLLLRERLDPVDTELSSKLLPNLHRMERTVLAFQSQNYEDWIMLLFQADTFGKAAMEIASSTHLRRKLHVILFQMFISARANAIAIMAELKVFPVGASSRINDSTMTFSKGVDDSRGIRSS